VPPQGADEVRTFATQKCIAEGDLYGNTQGIRPLPTSLRSATFPKGEGMTTPQILIYRVVSLSCIGHAWRFVDISSITEYNHKKHQKMKQCAIVNRDRCIIALLQE
jgi:hypothetical protein